MIDILMAQISAEESKPAGERNEERLSALRGQLEVHQMSVQETLDGTDNKLYEAENAKAVGEEFPEEIQVQVEPTSFNSVLD
jgi:hypothetical protein